MTTKTYLTILILAIISFGFDTGTEKCSIDKLYGDWVFIKLYKTRLAQIDTLGKVPHMTKFGIPIMTFNKTGIYIDNQGDYETKGKFSVDKINCSVKTFDDNGKNGDTLNFEITYLDDKYLLLVDNRMGFFRTYFYKRK